MSRLRKPFVALGAAVAIGLAACGDDGQPVATAACGDVAFTANTDDGAFDIRVAGTDCATARRVARATRDRRPADPLAFTVSGFRCAGTRALATALPGVHWRCERGDSAVTFTRN